MTDDVPKGLEEQTSEALREQQMVLRILVKHPGWEILARCAALQMAQYQRKALSPIQSMDDVPAAEYTKGVAQGIQEVLSIPEQVLDEIETELAARVAVAKARGAGNEDDETDASDDDGA